MKIMYLCNKCKKVIPEEDVLSGPPICASCQRKQMLEEKRKPKMVILVYDQVTLTHIED